MSAFSFTAPVISKEQEKAERDAFSEKEEKELRNDLYGSHEELIETEEMRQQGVALCRDSLDQIPLSQKLEYMEAVERAPSLVESESPSVAFLRCCKYDAWEAAQRLVEYWRVRKLIFGQERAYLPMTLDGAMRDDVELLQQGLIMILPVDTGGRSVFFLDRVRIVRAAPSRESILRCFFYFLHVLSEKETAQKRGAVYIVNLRGFDLYSHFNRILTKRVFEILNSMPVPCRAHHGCTGSGQSVISLVLSVVKHIAGKHLRHRLVLHAGSDKELVQEMELYGIKPGSIPETLHGDFTRADFETWLSEHRDFECQRASGQQE